MERVIRAALIVLLLAALLVGCGDDRAATHDEGALYPPPTLVEVPIGDPADGATVRVSQHQIDEAKAIGVPVGYVGPFGHVFVYIPTGSFLMGSPEDEPGRDPSEVQHKVHIDRGFYLQQKPEGRVMGTSDKPPFDSYPWGSIERILAVYRWGDSAHAYRLPTEAEWEYACRAGTQTRWWWGDRHPAASAWQQYRVNPWGLEDMGAHLEWTGDWYGDLPSWEVSDPMGAETGQARVMKGWHHSLGQRHADVSPEEFHSEVDGHPVSARPAARHASEPPPEGRIPTKSHAKVRLVAPVGYGLGHYGSVQVTFRLVDDEGNDAPNADYDLRVIAMNDRLAARVQNKDAVWVRIPKPKLPITLSMVPGSYYVYAEGTRDGKLVRGTEQKFHAQGATVDQIVPVPPKDVGRFGSGVQSEPK